MSSTFYQLRVRGHLSPAWSEELSGMALNCEANGYTSITGVVQDQAALFGLLVRIHDLGLELISVNQLSNRDYERR